MEQIIRNLISYNPQKFKLLTELIEDDSELSRGIFVNRTLKMDEIKYIGFDMDYTLAIYNKKEIEELAFNLSINVLLNKKNYPEIIKEIEYDPHYVIRGLVIDKVNGNILKLDRHKYVKRAEHGKRKLSNKEIRDCYPTGKVKQSEEQFISVDTLFSLPEAHMFCCFVDLKDRGLLEGDYSKLFDDIKECIDSVHRDNSLKSVISNDLKKYVYKDLRLPLVLDKFREKGKKLFLLTNSEWTYTNTIMNYLLENTILEYKSWTEFFDIIICHASKPDFFVKKNPFYEVDINTGEKISIANNFEKNKVYSNGNYTQFEEIIGSLGDQVLYIGDHIFGDILRSNKDSGWRTVLVVEELEEELEKFQYVSQDLKNIKKKKEKKDKIQYELKMYINKLKKLENLRDSSTLTEKEIELVNKAIEVFNNELKILEEKQEKLAKQIDTISNKIDTTFHPKWGPIFQESYEISRFGDQVKDYACIYTSRLSNFFFYPVNNYFKSQKDMMPHEV